ncbi:MAG: hypothetical protein ACJAWW_000850 [Sulfurimonas sp.]|jgi:hypothetical protein
MLEVYMPILQRLDTIEESKQELYLTIEMISSEFGVGVSIIKRILAGKHICYSSLGALMEVLKLDLNINKKVY